MVTDKDSVTEAKLWWEGNKPDVHDGCDCIDCVSSRKIISVIEPYLTTLSLPLRSKI